MAKKTKNLEGIAPVAATTLAAAESPLQSLFTTPNHIYKITKDLDIGGADKTLTIPDGCTLDFQGGSFRNGILKGTNTSIQAPTSKIFGDGTEIQGNFICESIFPQWWGANGDGIYDNTIAFQKMIDSYQSFLSVIKFLSGRYKITNSINFNNYDNSKNSPVFIGTSIHNNIIRDYGVVIECHNIRKLRGGIEILGKDNTNIVSPIIENIQIELAEDCDPLSFCLFIGDANGYSIRNCRFKGYNSVLYRSGTYPGAKSYAHIACSFYNTFFETNRYVDWDGVSTNELNKYGFALAYEGVFLGVPDSLYYFADSLQMDSCLIAGTIMSKFNSAVYNNCMFAIPGGYKPVDTSIFKPKRITDSNFSCSVGMYVLGGNLVLNSPYFEDVPKCIYIQKAGSIVVNSLTALGTLNVIPTVSGKKYSCEYFLDTGVGTEGGKLISIVGGSISKGNTGFGTIIRNRGMEELFINGLNSYKEDYQTTDVGITTNIIKSNIKLQDYIIEWKGNISSSEKSTYLLCNDRKTFFLKNVSQITRVEVFLEGKLDVDALLFIYTESGNKLKMQMGGEKPQIERIEDEGKDAFFLNNVQRYNYETQSFYKKFNISSGEKMKLSFTKDNLDILASTKILVKVYIHELL